MEWRDTTSYSRSEPRETRVPRSLSTTIGDMKLTIHNYAGCGDMVFMTCWMLDIKNFDLSTNSMDYAKTYAVLLIREFLNKKIISYQSMIKEIEENS